MLTANARRTSRYGTCTRRRYGDGGVSVHGRAYGASVTVTVCILSPTWMAWATSMPEVTLPKRL